jgi:hypothetical protein
MNEDCDAHALFGEGVAEKHRVAFGSAPLESSVTAARSQPSTKELTAAVW